MITYKRDVLERQILSEVKMARGSAICERVRTSIVEKESSDAHFPQVDMIL